MNLYLIILLIKVKLLIIKRVAFAGMTGSKILTSKTLNSSL